MSKEDQFSYESMVSKIKMWRDALEQGYSITDVFNSMCTYIGEQQREIEEHNEKIQYLNDKLDNTVEFYNTKLIK